MTDEWKSRCQKLWREWARPLLIIVIVACSFRSTLADWNYVPSGSMKPTILEGDRIFVNRLAYGLKVPFTTWHLLEWSGPRRGEVVVFYEPLQDTRYVKRIVGVPGDLIEIRDKQLFVNDQPATYLPLGSGATRGMNEYERAEHVFALEQLEESVHPVMINPDDWGDNGFGPVTVPDGHYFVLGDNRDHSLDSRAFGFVERHRIVGRAVAVAISVDPDRYYLPRWHRFFRELP